MPVAKWGMRLTLVLLIGVCSSAVQAGETVGLPATTAADTVRTNLWLVEALMGEIVSSVATRIPPAPAAIRLESRNVKDQRNEIFESVAASVLGAAGYDLFVREEDPSHQAAVDYVFSFGVQDIALSYPDVGRTLGIWRRWVARDLTVAAMVQVSEEASGHLLFSDRVERRYADRVDNGDFDAVNAATYDFTTAETSETGWQNRAEEIVVLGTLAGLVAIYFANTGN